MRIAKEQIAAVNAFLASRGPAFGGTGAIPLQNRGREVSSRPQVHMIFYNRPDSIQDASNALILSEDFHFIARNAFLACFLFKPKL